MKTSRRMRSLLAATSTAALFLAIVGSAAIPVAAQDTSTSEPQDACIVYGTAQADEGAAGVAQAADTDQVELQDQTGEDSTTPETDQVQDPSYSGSIAVDAAAGDQCAALSQLATITPDQAKAAVEQTGGVVTSIELDNENGFLVYSVQLNDGTDVKVDAGNGSILNTQSAGSDNEIQDSENGA